MKTRYNVYIILVVFLLLIQLLISGCATTVTKDVQKEDLFKEDLQRKDLVEEELDKEEVGLVGQKLYQDKCSLCHELPDINAYSYTSEQWAAVIDNMHTEEAKEFITVEETDKIKGYLGNMSQAR